MSIRVTKTGDATGTGRAVEHRTHPAASTMVSRAKA
jgi:hypothetical protein